VDVTLRRRGEPSEEDAEVVVVEVAVVEFGNVGRNGFVSVVSFVTARPSRSNSPWLQT